MPVDLLYMDNRIDRFYELHNNKWFHIMNWSLDIIKTSDKKEKYMMAKYGSCLYFTMIEPNTTKTSV